MLGTALGLPFSRASHWTPKRLPGLIALWDPRDSLTTYQPDARASIGEPIIRIPDGSPAGNDLIQLDGNRQPLLAYFNGVDASAGYAWDFNGNNSALQSALPSGLSGNYAASMYIVYQSRVTTGFRQLIGMSGMDPAGLSVFSLRNVNEWRVQHRSGDFITQAMLTTTPDIATYRKSPGAINTTTELRIGNQIWPPTAASSALTPNLRASWPIFVGAGFSAAAGTLDAFWDGLIGYVLIFNRTLSDHEHAKVTAWLSRRHGL